MDMSFPLGLEILLVTVVIPLEKATVGQVQGVILLLALIIIEGLEVILLPALLMIEGLEVILLLALPMIGGPEVIHLLALRILMDKAAALHHDLQILRTPHLGEAEVGGEVVGVVGVEDTLGLEVVEVEDTLGLEVAEDLDTVVILEAMEGIIVGV